jgi:hypothetical protein
MGGSIVLSLFYELKKVCIEKTYIKTYIRSFAAPRLFVLFTPLILIKDTHNDYLISID